MRNPFLYLKLSLKSEVFHIVLSELMDVECDSIKVVKENTKFIFRSFQKKKIHAKQNMWESYITLCVFHCVLELFPFNFSVIISPLRQIGKFLYGTRFWDYSSLTWSNHVRRLDDVLFWEDIVIHEYYIILAVPVYAWLHFVILRFHFSAIFEQYCP